MVAASASAYCKHTRSDSLHLFQEATNNRVPNELTNLWLYCAVVNCYTALYSNSKEKEYIAYWEAAAAARLSDQEVSSLSLNLRVCFTIQALDATSNNLVTSFQWRHSQTYLFTNIVIIIIIIESYEIWKLGPGNKKYLEA